MKEKKTSELIWNVVVNLVVLGFVNAVPLWRHLSQNVILDTWKSVVWAMNVAAAVNIVGNLLLAYYRPPRLRFFFEMLFDIGAFVSALVIYTVFPLDFSHLVGDWLNTLIRVLLIVGMIGASIGFVTHLVRFIRGEHHAGSAGRTDEA